MGRGGVNEIESCDVTKVTKQLAVVSCQFFTTEDTEATEGSSAEKQLRIRQMQKTKATTDLHG